VPRQASAGNAAHGANRLRQCKLLAGTSHIYAFGQGVDSGIKFVDVPQQALRGYAAPTGRGELAKRPAGTPVSVKAANENSTNNKMV